MAADAKTEPTQPEDAGTAEKLQRARAALKASVRATFIAGARDGLRPDQVDALREGLIALGWVPPDVLR